MLADIKRFFSEIIQPDMSAENEQREHGVQLATAALLMEMVRSDYEESRDERELVRKLLAKHFQLSASESDEILRLGDEEMDGASCLFEFTQLVDREFSPENKIAVIEMLWRVAFQDGRLDKYEEHLMRKVADLIHVSHAQLIQTKLRVEAESGS